MSSPAQAGPSVPKEKKGLGKILSRAKTVFKRGDSSKRMSTLSTTGQQSSAQAATPGPSTTAPATEQPAAAAATTTKETAKDTTKKEAPKSKYEDLEGVTRVPRSELFEERARKLGERFGLEIKQSEWISTEGTALRVEKPIRMRVHRTCHKCNATFAAAKECPGCQHVRCTKCVRHPPKRTEAERIASREKRAAILKAQKENAPIVPDYSYDAKNAKDIVLKRPSKTGGQDLIYKKPRQRVRRTCHECQTLFTAGSKTCSKCSHNRCTDCPRDPPKKDKYPFGYPGDEFGPNAVPHHECHKCKTIYPGGVEDGTACKKCQHEKCVDCSRLKPRKVEPEPDPEILKSIQAKIESLKLK
ncbi:hypothetical protein COL5a_008377 [Colletotrichum fioriniae]|uniref:uncharacterized protein n=1 Tax=Colletotrichum fioriniae TaxID=710243 RepID=UPI0032DB79A3|nr:hypothetical protein COL5a_008377 [Colletotrichum fioriniae]KAJ3944327.1 hypothetical protein N0V96_005853 [Colletotrichum fioriniae]